MSKRGKILLIKYGGSGVFIAGLAYLYIALRDFAGATLVEKTVMLCDAFTVPGLLLLMVGCLLWVSAAGALDGLLYALGMAARGLIPGGRLQKEQTYADYVEQRRAKRLRGYGFLFITGGISMALALAFLVAYYFVS